MLPQKDQRKYERYDTEVAVYFYVTYDVTTKVWFRIINRIKKKDSPKYTAVSRNVSAEGICIRGNKELHKRDFLLLEVLLPGSKTIIPMEGEVRWCRPSAAKPEAQFDIGVKLLKVDGQSVEKSIYHDQDYHVIWSIVLESVLGNFRILEQQRKGIQKSSS